MTNVVTGNFTLNPQDGWVLVGGAATAFLRITKIPHHIPVFLYNGASAPTIGSGVQGSGTVTFSSGVPTAAQTVTVGSETYTFVTLRAAPFQVTIGGTNLITATNFAAAVASDSTLVSGSDTGGVVTLTSTLPGTVGNYALATTGTHVAVSGANFTGGAGNVPGFRMECPSEHFDGAYGDNLYARIPTNSNGPVQISVWTL